MRLFREIACCLALVCSFLVLGSGLAAASAGPGSRQELQEAWLVGPSTAWAWIQDQTGPTAGGGGQAVELTTDGGVRWSEVTPPGLGVQGGGHWITGLFARDADEAWVTYGGPGSGSPQKIYATSDAGRTWTKIGPSPDDCEPDFVSASDGWCPAIGAAAGSEAVTLYRTATGGRSWRIVSRTPIGKSPRNALPFGGDKEIVFTGATRGWAIFEAPVGTAPLYETDDGGTVWRPMHVSTAPQTREGGEFISTPLVHGRLGAVGYSEVGPNGPETIVYITTDGGRDWHFVKAPGAPEPWSVDVITPESWRLLYGNRILATDDAGRTWQAVTTNHRFLALVSSYTAPEPFALFDGGRTGWVVAQSSTGINRIWRTNDSGADWHPVTIPGT